MSNSPSTFGPLVWPGAIVAAKYKLDAVIGEGGMGSVWSATHLGLGQPVAIKFISKDFIRSPEALRRFDSEARAAAKLRSRHVVQVFDTGTLEDGTPYIAMEILHGETLQTRVHRGGPLPLLEGIEIVRQSCRALSRAHAAGIVHRDIKPDNIFLAQSTDDDGYLVKILDFGIAKMGLNDQSAQGSTRTGAVLGTPLYMSPEQARGLKTIDHRTDLYSMGLVSYTMFTGNLAFSSESFGDLLLQICTAPLPSLAAGAPWLPPAVELWFKRACAREPQDRYASAQEFSDALHAAAGVTLPSRGSSLPEASGQGVPGTPGSSVSSNLQGFASSGAVASGTSSGISRSGEVEPGADALVVPGRGKLWLGIIAAAVLLVGGVAGAAIVFLGKGAHAPVNPAASVAVSPTPPPSAVPVAAAKPAPPEPAAPEAGSPVPVASHENVPTQPPSPHAPAQHPASAPRPARPAAAAAPAGPVDLGY
jgi:eukaryotic-like serine/threonine-protein kinase